MPTCSQCQRNRERLLRPHGLQPARLPCPSLSPRVCPNSCPLNQWCHPAISSSVTPFSSCSQSCPASQSLDTRDRKDSCVLSSSMGYNCVASCREDERCWSVASCQSGCHGSKSDALSSARGQFSATEGTFCLTHTGATLVQGGYRALFKSHS